MGNVVSFTVVSGSNTKKYCQLCSQNTDMRDVARQIVAAEKEGRRVSAFGRGGYGHDFWAYDSGGLDISRAPQGIVKIIQALQVFIDAERVGGVII